MENVTLNEDWNVLLSMFPSNWRQLATDTNAMALQLKIRLMPPAPSQQSKKDEEKEIKKLLPACGRCGDSHLGGCMKPPKPK